MRQEAELIQATTLPHALHCDTLPHASIHCIELHCDTLGAVHKWPHHRHGEGGGVSQKMTIDDLMNTSIHCIGMHIPHASIHLLHWIGMHLLHCIALWYIAKRFNTLNWNAFASLHCTMRQYHQLCRADFSEMKYLWIECNVIDSLVYSSRYNVCKLMGESLWLAACKLACFAGHCFKPPSSPGHLCLVGHHEVRRSSSLSKKFQQLRWPHQSIWEPQIRIHHNLVGT